MMHVTIPEQIHTIFDRHLFANPVLRKLFKFISEQRCISREELWASIEGRSLPKVRFDVFLRELNMLGYIQFEKSSHLIVVNTVALIESGEESDARFVSMCLTPSMTSIVGLLGENLNLSVHDLVEATHLNKKTILTDIHVLNHMDLVHFRYTGREMRCSLSTFGAHYSSCKQRYMDPSATHS